MANNVPLNTSANVATEWKRFKGQWQNYVKAAKIDDEEADRQAIFLACIGSTTRTMYLQRWNYRMQIEQILLS